jgi:hypothetical protein
LRDAVRELDADHPAAHAERREVGLVTEALDEPRPVPDYRTGVRQDRFEVELYDRVPPSIEIWFRQVTTSDSATLCDRMRLFVAHASFASGWVVRVAMSGEIFTLPLRLTARAASLMLRGGEQIATRALSFAFQAASVVRSRDAADFVPDEFKTDAPEPRPERETPERQERERETPERQESVGDSQADPVQAGEQPAQSDAPPPRIEAEDVIDLDAPPVEEPVHVSEEPTLAAEFAEPGAEDGAGAQLHIDEPWHGYREMNAKDIVERIGHADLAELAAIQLYESNHHKRQTVLTAVERQMRLADHDSKSDPERSNSNA